MKTPGAAFWLFPVFFSLILFIPMDSCFVGTLFLQINLS